MSTCIERKHLLSGEVHEYSCELIRYDGDFGILRYVIDRAYVIDGVHLAPGDITYAFYWTGRPYTLYTWHLEGTRQVLYYFNVADRIVLQPGLFSWRDLAVDVLIGATGSPRVLDEGELPPDLDSGLASYISEATVQILREHSRITAEMDRLLQGIAPFF